MHVNKKTAGSLRRLSATPVAEDDKPVGDTTAGRLIVIVIEVIAHNSHL